MIKLIKSSFFNEEETKKKLCDFITSSRQLSMGSKCAEFEELFSKYQKRKFSVCYNSGSSANLALIQALINLGRLKVSDQVGFSSLTWATNVMPIMQLGLEPVPIDVSMSNLNVNSNNLQDVINKSDLKALFLTNLLGFSGDIGKIRELCDANGIILIEDNCESFGSRVDGKLLGNFGLASTFSFYVGHHMSTIEGGMVCTDDKELYNMLLMTRAHGWDRNLDESSKKSLHEKYNINDFYSRYTFFCQGYNLRPTEIIGFLGIEQMKFIDKINDLRNKNFMEFQRAAKSSELVRIDVSHMDFVSNFAFPIVCNSTKLSESYKKKFEAKDVEIRPIVGGSMVEQPFFQNFLKERKIKYNCPNARKIHENGFYIPNNPELTKSEIDTMCSILVHQ